MNAADHLRRWADFTDRNPDVKVTSVSLLAHQTMCSADTVTEYNATKDALTHYLGTRPTWRDDPTFQIAIWDAGDWKVWLYGLHDMPMTED